MVEGNLIAKSKLNYPYVNVTVRIYDKDQINFNTFDQYCWVDTGCSAAIIIPSTKQAEALNLKVKLRPKPVSLAGRIPSLATSCPAQIIKINEYHLDNGIEISATFHGNDKHGLLGLDVINRWISEFHGPNRVLSIFDA